MIIHAAGDVDLRHLVRPKHVLCSMPSGPCGHVITALNFGFRHDEFFRSCFFHAPVPSYSISTLMGIRLKRVRIHEDDMANS
jgi:hypothetical protein